MGWVPAFSRLSPGIPLFARPPDLTCMSGGRVAFRHHVLSRPSPPGRMQGRRGALPVRRGGFAGPQPLGCKSAAARLQVCIRASTSLYPRGCRKLPVRVPVFIRADASLHPCRCDFASVQMRLCIRAGATFHPCRCDPASVQVRFLQPVRYKETPAGLPWRILAGVNLFLFKFRASSHRLQGCFPSAARLLLPFRPAFLRVVPPASGARPRRAVWRR